MKDAEAVTFAGGTLDRGTHLRGDVAQAGLRANPSALCLPLSRGRPLFDFADGVQLGWLPMAAPLFTRATGAPVFLGTADAVPHYAWAVPDWQSPALDEAREGHPDLAENLAFGDLRALMAELSPQDAGTAATAKGILGWHQTHGFCANCGVRSDVGDAGWKRVCPACSTQHFPRTDPVVIMLITYGNSLLLGRAAAWPAGMYSLLAGFMEPGESIEAAVRRETWEEVGLKVGAVGYLSSQPWPFPSSLMIGCRGEALDRAIVRDPVELEDARWLSREAVLAALSGQDPEVRPARRGSIARFLIERWLADRLD